MRRELCGANEQPHAREGPPGVHADPKTHSRCVVPRQAAGQRDVDLGVREHVQLFVVPLCPRLAGVHRHVLRGIDGGKPLCVRCRCLQCRLKAAAREPRLVCKMSGRTRWARQRVALRISICAVAELLYSRGAVAEECGCALDVFAPAVP